MRRMKQATGLFAYLERAGRLDAQGPELADLKKAYRREYERQWKRTYRAAHVRHAISFTPAEAKRLALAAKQHDLKITEFIKRAAFGYLDAAYVVQHKETVDAVLQTLLRYQTAIMRAEDAQKSSWFKPDANYRDLERILADVRQQVTGALQSPPKLLDLVRLALAGNEEFRNALQALLHGNS